jgi:hypothetical protein
MNTPQDGYQLPQMKASDADRDQVVAALSEHFQAGRLTSEELDERTGHALAARTLNELDDLMTDLPAPQRARQAQAPAAASYGPGSHRLVPIVPVLAAVAVLVLVLGAGGGYHGWSVWWVIPIALLVARRLAGGRGGARGPRRPH